ncbi:hypothetical protein BsWGS_06947 [Bradybaena similaris]
MSIKAFELVSAIERVKLMSDKAKTQIECLDVCGKNIYIGTNDCFVVHYSIEEKLHANGRITFVTDKQGHKFLVVKKPVVQLRAASALNRIMVLCDATLTLLNMFDLEPIVTGAKVKGVACFCINENPVRTNPFSVEICVALKRKMIQLYTVTEDRLMHLRDVSLPEQALVVGVDGIFVCAALASQYCMIDTDSGHITDLFPIDPDQIHPIIKRISKEEFLLNGPNALGIFVTSAGVSQRPPMQWSDGLTAVSFVHPYILAMNDEFITVHSILDQQQKQAIPFQGGVFLGDFDGRIFVASCREIYALLPIPFEKQIQALLADKRVQEALDLARNANKTGMTRDKFLKMFKRIQQQAAFIEFSQQHLEEAGQLFQEGAIDVREIISLYPHYLPTNANFTRSVPPLHEIADINQLSRSDEQVKAAYKHFLQSFLEDIRGTNLAHGYKREIDVALLKLYAESAPEKLSELISVDTGCDLNDCVEWLEKYQRLHALGLLYQQHGEYERALAVWTRLVDSSTSDPSFPGLEFVVEFLARFLFCYVSFVLACHMGIYIST